MGEAKLLSGLKTETCVLCARASESKAGLASGPAWKRRRWGTGTAVIHCCCTVVIVCSETSRTPLSFLSSQKNEMSASRVSVEPKG